MNKAAPDVAAEQYRLLHDVRYWRLLADWYERREDYWRAVKRHPLDRASWHALESWERSHPRPTR